MWIDAQTNKIARTHAEVRALRPNWGAGPHITEDEIVAQGFAPVRLRTPQFDRTTQDAVELPPANVDGVWVQQWSIADLTVEQIAERQRVAREAAWEHITAVRDRREQEGVAVDGHWYHTDDKSLIKYLGLKDAARDMLTKGAKSTDVIQESGHPILWHTLDDADVPMTIALAYSLTAAVKTLQSTCFAVAKIHKAEMYKLADPTGYDYSWGWPATYPGPNPD